MDAFTVAGQLLRDRPLSPEQLAQLRAINYRHAQRLHALRHSLRHSPRDPTEAEAAELRRTLEAEVRELLRPEQRRLPEES